MITKYEECIEMISYHIDIIARIMVTILMTIMFLLVLITIANRFILHLAFSWSEEIARYLFIWINMIGVGIVLRLGTHVAVEIEFFKKRIKNWLNLFIQIILLIYFFIVISNGVRLCFDVFQKQQTSIVIGLPMYFMYSSIPIGFIVMSIHTFAKIESISRSFRNRKSKKGA